nr:hypothetical protein [Erysipelotrichaceae bacterium]
IGEDLTVYSMGYDSAADRLVIADDSTHAIYSIDLSTVDYESEENDITATFVGVVENAKSVTSLWGTFDTVGTLNSVSPVIRNIDFSKLSMVSVQSQTVTEKDNTRSLGGLNAVEDMAPVASRIPGMGGFINMKTVIDSETEDSNVTITIKEDEAVSNGYYEVSYDPDKLDFVSAKAGEALEFSSVSVDEENGVVKFTFAGLNPVVADTVLATLKFTASCEDTSITVDTLERNDNLDLSEQTVTTVKGSGHKWGEPNWTWNEDFSAATAEFVCKNDESHTETREASITEEIVKEPTGSEDGEKLITATVTGPDGKIYSDEIRVTIPANPDVPDTGDHSKLYVYIAMTVVSALGMGILLFKGKKRLD